MSFNVKDGTAAGSYKPKISVGASEATLPDVVVAAKGPATITVTSREYGFDAKTSKKIWQSGEMGVELKAHMPGGTGSANLILESSLDAPSTKFGFEVCSAELIEVGKNLPCIDAAASDLGFWSARQLSTSKSSDTVEFEDKVNYNKI